MNGESCSQKEAKVRIAALLVLCSGSWSSAFAQDRVHLVCLTEITVQGNSRIPTVGETTFVITLMTDGSVLAESSKCGTMMGQATQSSIDLECEMVIGGVVISHHYVIDRVSGAYADMVRIGQKGGMVHEGKCSARKPLL